MYPAKSLKWDPATGDVAIRTPFADEGSFANMAWQIASASGRGARNASSAEVEQWVDIPTELLAQLIGGN